MTTVQLALAALILSAFPVTLLCLGDPKRRRAAGERDGDVSRRRRLLVGMACVPGLACLLLGDTAAFMLWLGGSALLGWALAAWFSAQVRHVSR